MQHAVEMRKILHTVQPAAFQHHVIPADLPPEQQRSNWHAPITRYETHRVPCSACGRPVVWTAEQQRTWYEEMKASIYATVNLRCSVCRTRGTHDHHRQKQRHKARERSAQHGT